MPRKPIYIAPVAADVPDVCDKCGQHIDKRSPASMERHATARHLPYVGKRPYRR